MEQMKNIIKFHVITVMILLINPRSYLFAEDLSGLKPYLRKAVSWKCATLNTEIPMNIYFLDGNRGPEGSEVIVYVKNKAWDRVGQVY